MHAWHLDLYQSTTEPYSMIKLNVKIQHSSLYMTINYTKPSELNMWATFPSKEPRDSKELSEIRGLINRTQL